MIVLNNCFDVEAPRQILLQINAPDAEGWRQYQMSLIANTQGDKLVEFEHGFSDMCIDRLKTGISGLLDGSIDQFDFEPLEPAFALNIKQLDSDEFELLCIVDVSYVKGGMATETGIGMKLVVKADEIRTLLEGIK